MVSYFGLLSISILFGGMTLYSFGFAPFVFKSLPMTDASALLRRAFPWYYMFQIGAGVITAGLFMAIDPIAAVIIAGCVSFAIFARQILMPKINDARDRELAGNLAAKKTF